MTFDLAFYTGLLADIKARIQQAQTRAVMAVNAELVRLYWDIGRLIDKRQQREGWGAAVIPRLAVDLQNDMPELKGFSERNIGRMVAFSRAYPDPTHFLPQAVAKTAGTEKMPQVVAKNIGISLLWQIPWGHHPRTAEEPAIRSAQH